ncbi:MAG: ABC transporter ATP-binding protein [Clostridia bacterium]
MSEILKLKNVGLTYYTKKDETQALENVSFSITRGDFVAVVGPSGCGKTTLLSLISGILTPTFGTIELSGCDLGYMLQRDHLFEWRSIYKNILLGLEIQKKLTKENLEHVDSLIEKYGLSQFKYSHPSQLSGGMRQRAALIRTLALKPDLLLLDEPFSSLDFQTRMEVCDDVYSIIKKENKTVLLVTHDISEAISMADKIVILSKRPAKVKLIHETHLSHVASPLKRREDKSFALQFETIWQEINK